MDLFSQAHVDALRRLKDAFEQKLLDEDEYKAVDKNRTSSYLPDAVASAGVAWAVRLEFGARPRTSRSRGSATHASGCGVAPCGARGRR